MFEAIALCKWATEGRHGWTESETDSSQAVVIVAAQSIEEWAQLKLQEQSTSGRA